MGNYNRNFEMIGTKLKKYIGTDSDVAIPFGITEICDGAFSDNLMLERISIPDSVIRIKDAFSRCRNLKTVEIADSVTEISWLAFNGCTNLCHINLPSKIKNVNGWWFGFDYLSLTQYSNAYYLGSKNNPFFALIKTIDKDVLFCDIHKDTVFIGCKAFQECTELEFIEIPSSVQVIEEYAFYKCENLKTVVFNEGLKEIGNAAFSDTSISSLKLPKSLEILGNSFSRCRELSEVSIPSELKDICGEVFNGCNALEYNSFSNGLYLGNNENPYVFLRGCKDKDISEYSIHPKTRYIVEAFYKCEKLKQITIPNNVVIIGEKAFANTGIKHISIPSSVKRIGYSAFSGCKYLNSIQLTNSVEKMNSPFSNNNNISLVSFLGSVEDWLKIPTDTISESFHLLINGDPLSELYIPEGTTTLYKGSISGCIDLSSVSFPKTIETIEQKALTNIPNVTEIEIRAKSPYYEISNGCIVDIINGRIVYGTNSAVIPQDESITSIGEYAFAGCKNMKKMIVPNNISNIGYDAFRKCESLEEITICGNIDKISDSLFYGCSSLKTITLPNGITEIGECAFFDCSNLEEIDIPEGVTHIGVYAFSGCFNLKKIVLPRSLSSVMLYWEDDEIFPNNTKLEAFFCGDAEDFESISVDLEFTDEDDDEDEISPYEVFPDSIVFNYDGHGELLTTYTVKNIDFSERYNTKNLLFGISSAEYDCENESLQINFSFFSKENDVRIWVKEIALYPMSGDIDDGEIYSEKYIHIVNSSKGSYTFPCLTLEDNLFNSMYICPLGDGTYENGYDEDICWDTLKLTLAVDKHKDDNCELISLTLDSDDIDIVGISDDEPSFQSNSILYIYKGNIKCHTQNHSIIQTTAILHGKTDNEISINVEYCKDCKKYLLEYSLYERYRNRYGVLIGNLRMVVNGNFDGEYDLALESPLKLSGYNVGQKEGLTTRERHYILAKIVYDGIMSKGDVIRYLSYFIRMNGARRGNELAVEKWQSDLEFIESYNMNLQPQVYISSIEKY